MIEAFSAAEIIAAQRDHHSLTDPQIDWVIDSTTDRRYEVQDRQIFDEGFVQQHVVHAHDSGGAPLSFRACLVVRVNPDGLIGRIDEYLDPADLAPLMRPTLG